MIILSENYIQIAGSWVLREAEKHETNYKLYSGFNKRQTNVWQMTFMFWQRTDRHMTNDFHVVTKDRQTWDKWRSGFDKRLTNVRQKTIQGEVLFFRQEGVRPSAGWRDQRFPRPDLSDKGSVGKKPRSPKGTGNRQLKLSRTSECDLRWDYHPTDHSKKADQCSLVEHAIYREALCVNKVAMRRRFPT